MVVDTNMTKTEPLSSASPTGAVRMIPDNGYPRFYAYFVIGILMLVSFQSRLDQQIPSLLVAPIRAAFALSDTQMSLVQGMSFAFFYALMGPLCGHLIDRYSRRNLIFLGVTLWSIMTIWSGLVGSYTELLLSRMGVGIGEAVLAPAAYSLIADYVGPEARGRALGIYMTAFAAGAGFSFIIGGAIVGALAGAGSLTLPVLGTLEPWRAAFIAVGFPGLILALLMFLVTEPTRREDGRQHEVANTSASYSTVLRYITANARVFALVTIAVVSAQFIMNILLAWMPTFFVRTYHWPLHEVGIRLGILFSVCSVSGFLISGLLSDRWIGSANYSGRLLPLLFASLLLIPLLVAWPLPTDGKANLVLLGFSVLATSVALGTLPTTLQEIAPNRMRGRVVTLAMLIGSLVGWGAGPTITAIFTDYLFKNEGAVGYSVILATAPIAALAAITSLFALKPYALLRAQVLRNR